MQLVACLTKRLKETKKLITASEEKKKSVAWFVWLCPVLQTGEAIFEQTEHFCNIDNDQIIATCSTTLLDTVSLVYCGLWMQKKINGAGIIFFLKKMQKKSLRGDTFLIVPWNHCQGSLELIILFGCRKQVFLLFIHLFIQYLLFIYVLILILISWFYSISVYFYFPTDYYLTQLWLNDGHYHGLLLLL